MPQTGERRTVVALRLDKATIEAIDARAEAEGLVLPRGDTNRSELIRLAIDCLLATPLGWRPVDERESRRG